MINQLFDINSIRQNITEVNQEVDKIKQNLQNLTAKIKIEVPSDIQTQINSLNTTFNSINGSLKEITEGQARYSKAMTESVNSIAEHIKKTRVSTGESKKRKVTEEEITKALTQQAKSIAEAAEQNRILRAAAKQLDLTEADNVETLKKYNQQIKSNTEFIRENSDAYVQQKMNIGNYNSVWKGLNVSVQQLVRELPSAKYGLDIFFLAISNNIPMLMDSIKAMQAFNKEMVATGQLDKKVSIGKELLKSLISWQTAIMLGVTLLVQYGDEIIKWVGNLIKGENALGSTAKAQKALNDAWGEGAKNAFEELKRLELLTKAAADNTLSMDDRKKAVKALKDQYPEYLKGLTDEQILTGDLAGKYDELRNSIIETARAQAVMQKATQMYSEIIDIQMDKTALKGINSAEDAQKYLDEHFGYSVRQQQKGGVSAVVNTVQNWIANTDYNNVMDIKKRFEAIDELLKGINPTSLIEETSGGGTKKPAKEYAEGTIGWYETLISETQELMKDVKDNEAYKVLADRIKEWEEEIKRIKGEQDKIKDYTEQIKKNGAKIAKDYIKALKYTLEQRGDEFDTREFNASEVLLNDQTSLTQQYNKRLIGEEQYRKALLDLQQKYAVESLKNEIQYAKDQYNEVLESKNNLLSLEKTLSAQIAQATSEELKLQYQEELSGVQQALANEIFTDENLKALFSAITKLDAELLNLEALNEKVWDDEKIKDWQNALQNTADLFNEIANLTNALHEARLQQIEEETEAVEKSHERQLESLERLHQQGAISNEEYEARKRLQEEMTEKKQEELAKKEAEIKQRQAKYDKANSIAQALINTAVAITQVLGNPVMIALASVMGALQVATIMATPLPKYAQGTKYHKGGLAVVGDGGKQEVVMTADGAYLTPDTPTVVNLPRGAKVIPDAGLLNPEDVHWAKRPFMSGLSYDEKGKPIIINDYSSLEKEQRLTRLAIEKQRKEMRKYERNRQLSEYKKRAV